ncbi:unnamed protein product [Linum trigynum]|uniref:Uncharacterized protein n=1 Tax=Linum trigynum TaxID=586398 RepID=A0AAV2EVD1_9ROSI
MVDLQRDHLHLPPNSAEVRFPIPDDKLELAVDAGLAEYKWSDKGEAEPLEDEVELDKEPDEELELELV